MEGLRIIPILPAAFPKNRDCKEKKREEAGNRGKFKPFSQVLESAIRKDRKDH
ncbi:hypothetical protein H1S01_03545 [Heliobacterium chlorum]|uniref:Uncharacterized protein n=1 Tax=Heliobacterium chlorum TaxID=2698 RepID=A0ABR7SYH7_HELCL|nr:hypothetical protein [Heliobacterium chlorum]MBC9783587.1 hypothetical protein [Heliobacterium chlorum]